MGLGTLLAAGLGAGAFYLFKNPQARQKLMTQMGPYIDRLPPMYRDLATQAGLRRGGSMQTRSSDVGTVIEGQSTTPPPNTNPPPTASGI